MIYRATIVGHSLVDSALIESTLHYRTEPPVGGDEPAPDDVATGIWGLLGTAFIAVTSTRVHIDRLDLLQVATPPGTAIGGTHSVNATGTLAASSLDYPAAACLGVNLRTATRSRRSRGFTHLPPCYDAVYSLGNTFGGAYLTNANTLAALLDNSFDLGSVLITHCHPCVYSPTQYKQGLAPVYYDVTSATVNPVCRFVKSRMTSP